MLLNKGARQMLQDLAMLLLLLQQLLFVWLPVQVLLVQEVLLLHGYGCLPSGEARAICSWSLEDENEQRAADEPPELLCCHVAGTYYLYL